MSTKKELIREIAELGITQERARNVVESILDEVTRRLTRGESVQVTNFGRFEVRQREGRTMVNPNTGEEHDIPPHNVVHFTPSENFKERFRDS